MNNNMNFDKIMMQMEDKDKPPEGVNDLEPFIMGINTLGRRDLAVECLDTFAKVARMFEQYDNLSKCYFKLKEYMKGIETAEKCLELCPTPQHEYVTRFNLINLYNHANYPEKAMEFIKINEKAHPSVDLDLEKAYSLYLLERKPEAREILEQALINRKDLSEQTRIKIKFNLGTYYLYQDKFQLGLRHFMLEGAKMKLWQVESIFARNKKLNFEFWEGDPEIKNLIVYAEAGIGDEIINVRFMKHLKDRGVNAIWYTATQAGKNQKNDRPGLTEMFEKNGVPIVTSLDEVPKLSDWQWTYSMRLPIYLGLEYSDLWYGPYLKACPEFKKKWQFKGKKKRIGLRWQGSKFYDHDLHRSYPVKQLYEAIGKADAEFISLQKDDGVEEIPDFPGLVDISDKLETLEDTLALIANLDYVVTSCTSVAHMAASQGKRTFILVPISAYYTWSHSGKQSPWYGDHVTLLRQKRPRVWDEPIAELVTYLKKENLINED
jgi:tetratricopeptide (TPR) repeat protein